MGAGTTIVKERWQCRWSSTLGALEDTHQNVWGTDDYTDDQRPTVFFGLYGLPDFYALWRHKGIKEVLWAGTDIIHFKNGYWLEEGGTAQLGTYAMRDIANWITRNCGSWVENEVERKALEETGVYARVRPSFLGDVTQYDISYKWSKRPKVYASVSGDNFEQYGWPEIMLLASNHPRIAFNFYGNTKSWPSHKNVKVHGRVPKEQMNKEICTMQGALRPLSFDGFSEVLAKSILWGQWPVSKIKYPHILSLNQLPLLCEKKEPNIEGREYYLRHLNQFPWAK